MNIHLNGMFILNFQICPHNRFKIAFFNRIKQALFCQSEKKMLL